MSRSDIKLVSVRVEVRGRVGQAYARRSNEAVRHLQERIKAHPCYASPHFILGVAYFYNGMYEKAVEELRIAISIEGRSLTRPLAALGWSLARMGKVGEARKLLEELKGRKISRSILGAFYLELGEKEEAVRCIEEALEAKGAGAGLDQRDAPPRRPAF